MRTGATELAALVEMSRAAQEHQAGHMPGPCGAWLFWAVPNPHDAAVVPVSLLIRVLAATGLLQRGALLNAKLRFLRHFQVIPKDMRCATSIGHLPVRLLIAATVWM